MHWCEKNSQNYQMIDFLQKYVQISKSEFHSEVFENLKFPMS